MGSIPLDRHGAHLFFPRISRRYARGASIVTANQRVGPWAEVCSDPIVATAILDRRLPHSHVINITGDSYRLTEQQKAGLLKRVPAPDTGSPQGVGDFSVIAKGPFSMIVDTAGADSRHTRCPR